MSTCIDLLLCDFPNWTFALMSSWAGVPNKMSGECILTGTPATVLSIFSTSLTLCGSCHPFLLYTASFSAPTVSFPFYYPFHPLLDPFPSALLTSCCHYQFPPVFCLCVYVCDLDCTCRCVGVLVCSTFRRRCAACTQVCCVYNWNSLLLTSLLAVSYSCRLCFSSWSSLSPNSHLSFLLFSIYSRYHPPISSLQFHIYISF